MKNRPIDAVNMGALPDTAPPRGKTAPKRALTREEALENIRRAKEGSSPRNPTEKSGKVQRYAKGGKVRGDGMCTKGHTKGRMV